MLHVPCNSRPEQHNHAAIAMTGMDTGTAKLNHRSTQVVQAGNKKLGLAVVALETLGLVRVENTVRADNLLRLLVTHNQVIAVGIKKVFINT